MATDPLPLSKLSRMSALELSAWAACHLEGQELPGETLLEYEARTTYRLPACDRERRSHSAVYARRKWNNYHQEPEDYPAVTGKDER